MNIRDVATKAAHGLGDDVENAVRMKLREMEEGHATRAGGIDFATAVGLASLIVQCAQFALELRQKGKKAEKERLRRFIDDALHGAGSPPDATRTELAERVARVVLSE
jgi:hypothetical protein